MFTNNIINCKNVHEGEKPANELEFSNENASSDFVECVICDISFFGTSATLEKHMKDVHNGQKKQEYMAAVADMYQMQEENLNIEFSCKFCENNFEVSSTKYICTRLSILFVNIRYS